MAKNRFTFMSCKSTIENYESLMSSLEDLTFELKGTNLENLTSFVEAYLIILKNIEKNFGTGIFTNDELVRTVEVRKAHYFFSALKKYVNREITPIVWKEFFEQCEQNISWSFVYISMGFNANINFDLPFALRDVVTNESYKEDFEKIYDIVSSSIREIIEKIHVGFEENKFNDKKYLTAYSIFFNVIYHKWSEAAWDNFINLRNGFIKTKYLEKNALNILKQIIGVSYFRQFFSKGLSKLELFQNHIKSNADNPKNLV